MMLMLVACACLCCTVFAAQQPNSAVLRQYFEQGHEALAQRRYADAEKAFEKVVELDPTAAIPRANLALVYFEEGEFAKAVAEFQQSLKLDSNLTNSRYFLAMSLSELGRYKEALPELNEGFNRETDPKLKRLLGLHLERAYTGLDRNRDAVEVALKLSKLYPRDPEVLYQTARLCSNFAYQSIQTLGQVAPDSVWRHLASADFYQTQGHYALAIREYQRVLALAPKMPGIHYRLGRALLRAKQPGSQAKALAEFQAELRLDPSNASAAYEAAQIYRNLGELEKAHELLTSALSHYPDFEEAQLALGRLLNVQKEPAQALLHLKKAVAIDPADSAAYFQLARTYHALGDTAGEQRAMAQFRKLTAQAAKNTNALAEDSPN